MSDSCAIDRRSENAHPLFVERDHFFIAGLSSQASHLRGCDFCLTPPTLVLSSLGNSQSLLLLDEFCMDALEGTLASLPQVLEDMKAISDLDGFWCPIACPTGKLC